MTWFKVDDQFHDHGKVRRLGAERLAAAGLWVLCGSWAADRLSDGLVPAEIACRHDPPEKYAARLVEVGLWLPAECDGERGYVFHDWADMQPTREEVLARRRADALRRTRWRQARSQQEPQESRRESQQGSRRDSRRESRQESRQESRVESQQGSRCESALPDPTRPGVFSEDTVARASASPPPNGRVRPSRSDIDFRQTMALADELEVRFRDTR